MNYTLEDIRRLVGAKSTSRIRNLLCRPEFEKKRIINPHLGRRLVYKFDLQDLKNFREVFGFCTPNRSRGQ